MSTPTSEQIEKLPKWAQDHLRNLQRERDVAIRELNEWVDSQTPSAFSVSEMLCIGEQKGPSIKRRYIQGHRMEVVHAGIHLDISLGQESCIRLQWEDERRLCKEVAMVPKSFNNVELIAKENLR